MKSATKRPFNRVHVNDLHATILHLLGLDHLKLTYRLSGRDFRLTDVARRVVKEVVAWPKKCRPPVLWRALRDDVLTRKMRDGEGGLQRRSCANLFRLEYFSPLPAER